MANSKFLPYQDKDNTGLLDKCDELIDVTEPKECPPCQKNLSYIAPDWTTKNVDEPWLNEKTCKFEITIETEETSLVPYPGATEAEASEYIEAMFENYQEEAIDGILDFTNKQSSEEIIESLKSATEFSKYDLSQRIKTRAKLLYAIPYDNVSLVENITEDQEDESDEDGAGNGDIDVIYDADTFNANALKVRRALQLYGKFLKLFKYGQNGNIIFEDNNSVLELSRYGDNGLTGSGVLERIVKSIDDFLNSKGYRLRAGAWSKLKNDIVTEIGFKFSEEYRLKQIIIKTVKCGEKEIIFKGKKIKHLKRRGDFKDSTGMAYLANLDNMLRGFKG